MLPHIQVDDLVWNNGHALEGQSLCTSPWEALNHPALSLLLETSDLLLDQIGHDLVIDVLEIVEALLDAISVGTSSLDMIAKELASADTFPFEVLGESLEVLLTVRSWCTEQEYASNLLLLNLLKHELKRVIGSRHNQLLEKVFEELIHSVVLEVLLDGVHIVELLFLVHGAI